MCGEMPGMFIISRAIYLSGYLSISRDIYLSIFVPGCPSPGLSISRDIYPSPGLSISRAVHLPGCLSPRLSIISRAVCLPGYLFPGLSISRTISLDIYLSVYLSLHLPGHLPVSLPICPRPCWLRSRQRQAQNPRNAPAPFPCPAPGRAAEILGAAGTAPCRSARGGAAFAPEGARCVRAGILGSPPSPPGFFSLLSLCGISGSVWRRGHPLCQRFLFPELGGMCGFWPGCFRDPGSPGGEAQADWEGFALPGAVLSWLSGIAPGLIPPSPGSARAPSEL